MRCRPFFALLVLGLAACATNRNVPAPLAVAPERDTLSPFARAVARGTRTWTGEPGPHYWQQWARYRISASIDPGSVRLTGTEDVVYLNRSPDSLGKLAIELYQNIHLLGAKRDESMPVTGGLVLTRVVAEGIDLPRQAADSGAGYRVDGTIGWISLPHALAPGDSLRLAFAWSFKIPPAGGPRMGQDGVTFFLGQWYPQLAVYDDVGGWQTDQYLGIGEFYMGYADYDVSLTVPDNWLVAATGELANPEEVLSARTRERLAQARATRQPVHIVGGGEQGAGRATMRGVSGTLTWHFAADDVRDFAFGASSDARWDAAAAVVGDRDGTGRADTALVDALYRASGPNWNDGARYVQHSIEFLSRYLWPYPYSHMTAFAGIVSGGMEYPMITVIGSNLGSQLYSVTVHEVGHMWFPMLVGSDEKRFAWMDEGFTEFDETQGERDFQHKDTEREEAETYLAATGAPSEGPLVRHSDAYANETAYIYASYYKPVAVMRALRGVLGDSLFLRGYREYGRRWTNRHPYPQDFWNTMSQVAGQDLTWFWREWFLETWTLDQAIGGVKDLGDSLEVTIENRGRAIMPVPLEITREGGAKERISLPVEIWKSGVTRYELRLSDSPHITHLEIDPERLFPDTHRRNNSWSR